MKSGAHRGEILRMSPDSRHHRGTHPSDAQLFAEEKIPMLRTAAADLSWLLTRGYAPTASLKLVGDHYQLRNRQRVALSRAACGDQELEARLTKCVPAQAITGADLIIDGFNLLITIESALSGGLLLHCRDGCLRDLASVHGTYRSVEETATAIRLAGETLATFRPRSVEWLFDRPVSNSGRLAQKLREEAEAHDWPWMVTVVINPDTMIMTSDKIALTSDSSVLDHVKRWVNFRAEVLSKHVPQAWIIELGK
jgi:hypothetical protein